MYRAYRVPKQGAAHLVPATFPPAGFNFNFKNLRLYGYIVRVDPSGSARRVTRTSADEPPRARR